MLDRFMGVNINTIGGQSEIDGETAPQTSVGSTSNSIQDQIHWDQSEKIKDAESKAYKKSGEIVVVIVVLAAAAWSFFVSRARRRRNSYQAYESSNLDEEEQGERELDRHNTGYTPCGTYSSQTSNRSS